MLRKVCVVVASRANYGRVKYVLSAILAQQNLELQLVVGASTLLERFGNAINVIRQDGFEPIRSIHYVVEGETLLTQAKSTGLGIIELSSTFEDIKPDIVLTVADRFETMATAIAASYLNIPLVHLQGGEVSGNIDDKVRHAITKLADWHFVATRESEERVLSMGEKPETVFNYGCPAMDVLASNDLSIDNVHMSKYLGVGPSIDWEKPYILVVQHPVTTSFGNGFDQITTTLNAMIEIGNVQVVVMWPNVDAGSDDVSKGIRHFREANMGASFHYFKNFSPEDYGRVLNNTQCCVGNSSSFIREGAFLGVPAVIIGDRQEGREHSANVINCDYVKEDIIQTVKKQLKVGRYNRDYRFGTGDASARIAKKLLEINLHD